MSDDVTAPSNYINCDISFGTVPVGTIVVKPYPLKNRYHETVLYYVTRNTQINPIYYVFDINKYEVKIEGGGEYVFKVSYSPNVVGAKNFDYFTITDSRQNYYRFSFRGECAGPLVETSIRNLNFLKTRKFKETKKTFLLKNDSICPAIFQFDCNEEHQGVFSVEPVSGTIEPHSQTYIKVTFSPQVPRFYSRQLAGLILYHEPVLINLFGIYSLDVDYDLNKLGLHYYPFRFEDTVSFAGYLSDSVTLKRVPPPISFTVNYLDFGRIMPNSSCQTLTTSFTNHMDNEVVVEWEKVDHLFKIYPEKLEIPPKQSALYECRFQPDSICCLSSAIINGHVSWIDSDDTEDFLNVPISMNLRFIGHSFPEKQAWIPSISIVPNNVILPLSLPNFPSATTFMIKSYGHLPVLYKLLPPYKTNFIMKPMVGLIRNYQIIAVQLESSSNEPNSYIEKWNLELNGLLESSIPIYIKAQTDIPRIVVANDNYIKFETMQPGTQASLYVPIRNLSFCHIRYEFPTLDFFGVEAASGLLAPNEEIFVTCWYQSDLREIGESEFQVNCRIQCLFKEKASIGEAIDIPVTVAVEVVYSELCALPSVYQCGEIEYGLTIRTCFYIFNFGESNINFKLNHDHDLKDVVLRPNIGKCGTHERMMVSVEFTVHNLGKNSLNVAYNNRLNQFSDNTIEGSKSIFRIEYEGIYATLQITDLLEHNLGPLFSNNDLWEMLKIDEINNAFRETNQGEIRRVELTVPDCEVSEKLYYLVLVIKNTTSVFMRLGIKRRQVCNCKQKQSNESLTFRIKVFDCPHKELFNIEIGNPSMPPHSAQPLTFKIKHTLPDQNMLSYLFEMNNERTIILNIDILSIPSDSYILSIYNNDLYLNLGFVFIGLREAPVFAYWLYNNTSNAVPYKLDDLEITKLCNKDRFPVLRCLNSIGFVKPHSSAPLLFKFWPIEVKCYKVEVSIMLGTRAITLQIEGNGTDQKNKYNFEIIFNLIQKPLLNNVISLSVDSLIIEPILVANSTERLFFIKNRDKNHQILYRWLPCLVDGLVTIETTCESGYIKPRESHPIVIKITSLNEPCSIRILFCCEFVDYDQLLVYQASSELLFRKRRSSLKEFIISDGENVKNRDFDDFEMPPAPQYFHIALPIYVNVIGHLDRDNCVSVEDQMKQKPCDSVEVNIKDFLQEYFEETKEEDRPLRPPLKETKPEKHEATDGTPIAKEITKTVLEYLASDSVFSDYFQEKVNTMKTEPCPLYSQIKFDERAREEELKKETRKFFTAPKLTEVTDLSKEAVIHGLETTFHLKSVLCKESDKKLN